MTYLMIDSEFEALQNLTPPVDAATFQAFKSSIRAEIATNQDSTAHIDVKGVLTENPSIMAQFMPNGGTAYSDIRTALIAAEDNSDIKNIQLNIDSGGGTVAGLFYTIDFMSAVTKPINAVVSNMAASAAYALAAAADTIEATNEGALFGSIGTAKSFITSKEVVTLTNSESPNKIPDVTTDTGKETVTAELDAIYSLFADKIANGRQTSIANINENYGKGAVLLADDALSRGMIDKLSTVAAISSSETTNVINEAQVMNLQTLKVEHSALYAEIVEQAKAEGRAEEQERVNAHLLMGKELNGMDIALAAIESGEGITPTISAKYTIAGANMRDSKARLSDNVDVETTAEVTENAEAVAAPKIMAMAAEHLQIDLPKEVA